MYERDKINDGKSLYDKIYFSVLFCVFLHLYIDVYINLCGERLRRLLEIGISNFDVCFDLKQGKNPKLILIFCGPFVCSETSRAKTIRRKEYTLSYKDLPLLL